VKVKAGYKQTEVGVIPEEWEVKPFTQVTDLITCGIAATPDYVPESRGYPFLSSTNVKEGRIVWSGYKHISADLHRQLYRNNPPKRGDILYSRVGTFGEAAVVDADFEFSVYVSLTLIKPGKSLHSYFLMQLLNSNAYKQRAKDQIYLGGGVGNLNVDVVRRYPIVVPPLPEQRAIATALSDVDGLLGGLDRLIAKKRDLKQAAMQQLLTGQTRLPGFHGEWEVKRLGDVVETDPENLGSDTRPDFLFNYIALEDVDRGFLRSHSEQLFASAPSRARRKLRPNDVLVSTVRPNLQSHLLFKGEVGRWVCSTGFCVVRCREGITHPGYVLFHLFAGCVNRQIDALLTGSNYPAINSGDVRALQIPVPPHPEQTAIAEVLTEMDGELAGLEQRREKTRALKQAMMQELLTGRTRLI
jgi:type I restriction enzyme S subunit